MSVHFSSATGLWATPMDFFKRYDDLYGFELVVCAVDDIA